MDQQQRINELEKQVADLREALNEIKLMTDFIDDRNDLPKVANEICKKIAAALAKTGPKE